MLEYKKKSYKKEKIILAILIVAIIAINYPFIDSLLKDAFTDYEIGIVDRVIDGDTVKIGNESVRLLGINCPEKGEKYYSEAKEFLEEKVLNKTVEIRFGNEKYDFYKRKLGYIFLEGKNINLEIVEKGFANFYFPSGKDAYFPKFYSAWETCIEKEINLCEFSEDKCAKCISLEDWDIENQIIELKNNCENYCELTGWSIKDEGTKKYTFQKVILEPEESIVITAEDFNKDYVWTKTGDTIYIRDNFGKLILWKNY
jgi:hypothetical protein